MYRHLLVPVDGGPPSQRGLDEAIALARALDARLTLLHVVDDQPLMANLATASNFETLRTALRDAGSALLAQAAARARDAGAGVETRLAEAAGRRVAEVIVEQARELGADLVVIGTHGRRGLGHLVLGSDAERVLRTSPVPVLLVRPPAR